MIELARIGGLSSVMQKGNKTAPEKKGIYAFLWPNIQLYLASNFTGSGARAEDTPSRMEQYQQGIKKLRRFKYDGDLWITSTYASRLGGKIKRYSKDGNWVLVDSNDARKASQRMHNQLVGEWNSPQPNKGGWPRAQGHHNYEMFWAQAFIPAHKGKIKGKKPKVAAGRVAAKYKNKKQVDKADGSGKTTVYEYSKGQVDHRNREKAKRIEGLKGNILKLRSKVQSDLTSDDPKTRLTALAISLMDETCERVGNDESVKERGHFGVTTLQAKHVKINGGKATLSYTGKSGVKHSKTVENSKTVSALKKALNGKSGTDTILCDGDDCTVRADDVNGYLKEYDITAKDIRGYRANDEMVKQLKEQRSKGKELPNDRKEKDEILKAEFTKALEATAEVVGHESSTLRSQYLVPKLEDSYVHDGTVMDKWDKKANDAARVARRVQAAGKYDHINFKPPEGVANAAARGLEYRQKASPSNKGGLTPSQAAQEGIGSGVQRAVNLKNRNTLTPETIKKMVGFFARHEKNKGVKPENKGKPYNDKGHVAWLLWGGDPGKAWCNKVKAQMEAADKKSKQASISRIAACYLSAGENEPTNSGLWAKVVSLTKGEIKSLTHNGKKIDGPNEGKGFQKYPTAYANGWASKVYGDLGGGWTKKARGKAKKDVGHGGLDEWFSGHGGSKGKGEDATWGDWVSISPVTKTLPSGKKVERGDIVGDCGISSDTDWKAETKGGKNPLKCMPRQKAHKMDKAERADKAKAKQKAEKSTPNSKKPTNTPTFQKKAGLKPADVHHLADKLNVPWDNDPAFLKWTKGVTGKEHLDDLNQGELKSVMKALKQRKTAEDQTADLNPQLGWPGGPCHVVERIHDEVRSPRMREDLSDKVLEGDKLTNPEANKIYDMETERGTKVKFLSKLHITPHAQYRMDQRGITVYDLRAALQAFAKAFYDSKSQNGYEYQEWSSQLAYGREVRWTDERNGKLVVVFQADGRGGVKIITTFWEGKSDPKTNQTCDVYGPKRIAARHGWRAYRDNISKHALT